MRSGEASMERSARISTQNKPEAIETAAAQSNALRHPHRVATYAVAIGDTQPPRFPNMFMNPDREPVNSSVRSMHVAQKVVAANMLNPAPRANKRIALIFSEAWLPNHSRMPAANMPRQAASR